MMKLILTFCFFLALSLTSNAQSLIITMNGDSGCVPFTASLSNNYAAQQGTFLWDFGDNSATSSVSSALHTYGNPGTYTISLTYTPVSGSPLNATSLITVLPPPVAQFSSALNGNIITLVNQSSGSASCWWGIATNFAFFTSATGDSVVIPLQADSTYNIMQIITNAFGCSDTAIQQVIVGISGVNDPLPEQINIFPTVSADGKFYIETAFETETNLILITDACGRVVYTDALKSNRSEIQLQAGAGIYFITVISKQSRFTSRLVVTNQ